ncbi:MAG: BON domain-containing protein [Legionella sp. 40-6]|nr:BON domain-containing protein [Legionella sp.]OJY36665.1 MAG: BON domain-containing protein [Legionella sp. 40-6]
MQKQILGALSLLVLGQLTGCQTNTMTHRPYAPAPFTNPSFQGSTSLTESVQEALMSNDDLAVAPIRVETWQNRVILSGYVKKIRQSDMAEQIARQVPGVQGVENRIIVRP